MMRTGHPCNLSQEVYHSRKPAIEKRDLRKETEKAMRVADRIVRRSSQAGQCKIVVSFSGDSEHVI
jgi:hypothetical protein